MLGIKANLLDLRIWEVVWVSVQRKVGSLGLGAEDGRFDDLGVCLGFG